MPPIELPLCKSLGRRLIRRYTTPTTSPIAFEKPKITGAGPFAARPQFNAIGHPSNILSISLPQSSSIYFSQSSIVAANVELNTIQSEVRSLYGVAYQQLKSTESSNLLIHGQSHYRVLDAASHWTVFDNRRIIGWTGTDVDFSQAASNWNHNVVELSGKGHVVLEATSEILQLQVESNSEAFINPNALIAVNTGATINPEVLNPGTYELHKLELPHFDWPHWITNPIKQARATIDQFWAHFNPRQLISPIAPYWAPIQRQLSKLWRWTFVKINGRLIRRNPIFFKITGPATILIDNKQMLANNKLFTSKEITKLFRK